ncbi:MAG: hypothetical protein R3A50_08500 [Saprospiraceae bacterium]|nr:hypothetical protein [Saprospiraceae bacterium]MCB9344451.1 hypothetical protein [Lewinellaceae bacterium]
MDKKAVKQAVEELINNQIATKAPPETKETLDRLLADGMSKEEARKLIGQCILIELFYVYKHKKPFGAERYVRNLKNLPKPPVNDPAA